MLTATYFRGFIVTWTASQILSVWDRCAEDFNFPMLDNGYVYLAATRLSLYASSVDWAMCIEIFGFAPRSGLPDVTLYTFGSNLLRSKKTTDFVSSSAYDNYLSSNPFNECTFAYPIEAGDWQDPHNDEFMASGPHEVVVRGHPVQIPAIDVYAHFGIGLKSEHVVHVFEFCRLLAERQRDLVLATEDERRRCIPQELRHVLTLNDWHHPDLASGELPSATDTFTFLAKVLTGEESTHVYGPKLVNTHWSNWPEAGTL